MLKLLVTAVGVAAVVLFVAPPPAFRPAPDPAAAKAKDAAEAACRAADVAAVRRFDDPDGFFSVAFPGQPTASNVSANNPFLFNGVAGRRYSRELDGLRYEAWYERWNAGKQSPRERLDAQKPKLLSGIGLVPPRVRPVLARDAVAGFESFGVVSDRPRKFQMLRLYLVPEQPGVDRFYAVSVRGPADWLPSAETRAFLDSFELTERALEFPLPGAPGAVLKK